MLDGAPHQCSHQGSFQCSMAFAIEESCGVDAPASRSGVKRDRCVASRLLGASAGHRLGMMLMTTMTMMTTTAMLTMMMVLMPP